MGSTISCRVSAANAGKSRRMGKAKRTAAADEPAGTEGGTNASAGDDGLIALLAPDGGELDRVTYGAQAQGISHGRLPDGSGAFQALLFSTTRGARRLPTRRCSARSRTARSRRGRPR